MVIVVERPALSERIVKWTSVITNITIHGLLREQVGEVLLRRRLVLADGGLDPLARRGKRDQEEHDAHAPPKCPS